MKTIAFGIVATALIGLTGCGSAATTGGGPAKGDQISIDRFMAPVSLKQGEEKEESLKVSRGKNASDTVGISFSDDKKGLTFTPSTFDIKGSDNEGKFKIKAADDADLDVHTVTVTGKTKGEPAKMTFEVKVSKK
jgi:hypothetical protein